MATDISRLMRDAWERIRAQGDEDVTIPTDPDAFDLWFGEGAYSRLLAAMERGETPTVVDATGEEDSNNGY